MFALLFVGNRDFEFVLVLDVVDVWCGVLGYLVFGYGVYYCFGVLLVWMEMCNAPIVTGKQIGRAHV